MLFDYLKESVKAQIDEEPLDVTCICRRYPVIGASKKDVFVRVVLQRTKTIHHVVTLRLEQDVTAPHHGGGRPFPKATPQYRAVIDRFTSLKTWVTTNFMSDVFSYWDEWKYEAVHEQNENYNYEQIVDVAVRVANVLHQVSQIDFKHTPCAVLKAESGDKRFLYQVRVPKLFAEYNQEAITITDKTFKAYPLRSRKVSWASQLELESLEWRTNRIVAILEGFNDE